MMMIKCDLLLATNNMNYSCLKIKFLWKYLNLRMVMLIEPFGMLYNNELCCIHESCVGVRMVKCRLEIWLKYTYKECIQNFSV